MSRYTGPRLKIVRRLGELPGLIQKNAISKKSNLRKKSSQYGVRLETKQKLRYHYGIAEKQLVRYVKKARSLKGSTGKLLLKLLEMRLDNILFRAGLANSIPSARQMINHGHILVNNQKMNIPSYQCQLQDKISINASSPWKQLLTNKDLTLGTIPSHLYLKGNNHQVTILDKFRYEEVGLKLNELLIVEYYSRS